MFRISTFRFLFYLSVVDLFVLAVCPIDVILRYIVIHICLRCKIVRNFSKYIEIYLIQSINSNRFGFQIEIRSMSTLVCRLHTFFTYFLTHLSSILLMAVSIDRALIVNSHNFSLVVVRSPNSKQQQEQEQEKQEQQQQQQQRRRQQRHRCFVGSSLPRSARREPTCDGSSKLIASTRSSAKVTYMRVHQVDVVFALIVVGLALLNSHYILFMDLSQADAHMQEPDEHSLTIDVCYPLENTRYHDFLRNVWVWIDVVVYSLLPFVVMSLCSTLIVIKLRRQTRDLLKASYLARETAVGAGAVGGTSQNTSNDDKLRRVATLSHNRSTVARKLKRNRQILYMLLINNVYFLASILPCCVGFIVFGDTAAASDHTVLVQLSLHILLYTNNAVNFFLYGLSSQKFREELSGMIGTVSKWRASTPPTPPPSPPSPAQMPKCVVAPTATVAPE